MKPNYSSSSPLPFSTSSSLISNESETRNWLELPRDITAMILQKVGPIDVLNNAQCVCTLWRSISKDPLLWRVIDMTDSFSSYRFPYDMEFDLNMMCRHAIDRSQGSLVAISLSCGVSDNLLHYIADSATHLQRLCLVRCYDVSDKGLSEVVIKLPFLEEIDLTIGRLSEKSLKAIGRCCPLLRSLKFNLQSYRFGDKDAFVIAQTMPNLHHLQLYRNGVMNEGVLAILDGCPHLESLDLTKCFLVDLGGSLGRRCAEQIKDLLKPDDPIDDLPFNYDEYQQADVDLSDYEEDYSFDHAYYDDFPDVTWHFFHGD